MILNALVGAEKKNVALERIERDRRFYKELLEKYEMAMLDIDGYRSAIFEVGSLLSEFKLLMVNYLATVDKSLSDQVANCSARDSYNDCFVRFKELNARHQSLVSKFGSIL